MPIDNNKIKIAVIAGAVQAIKYKEKNWKATEAEIIKYINKDIDKIIEKIDNPL